MNPCDFRLPGAGAVDWSIMVTALIMRPMPASYFAFRSLLLTAKVQNLTFYSLFQRYARFALRIYCRKLVITHPEMLRESGTLLIAANHPNSFLDGVILCTLFDQPLHTLARGDAFRNRTVATILGKLGLLPVYRTSEGKEN